MTLIHSRCERFDFAADTIAEIGLDHFQIMVRLKVDPELRAVAEVAAEPQCELRCNRTPAADQLVNHRPPPQTRTRGGRRSASDASNAANTAQAEGGEVGGQGVQDEQEKARVKRASLHLEITIDPKTMATPSLTILAGKVQLFMGNVEG